MPKHLLDPECTWSRCEWWDYWYSTATVIYLSQTS